MTINATNCFKLRIILFVFILFEFLIGTNILIGQTVPGGKVPIGQFSESKLISGKVINELQEPMPDVSIKVIAYSIGTFTDENGNFELKIPKAEKVVLNVSYPGYSNNEIVITPGSNYVQIKMELEYKMFDDVVVSASRVNEKIMESPVSVEKLDLRTIRDAPTINVYETVGLLKGVDITSSSLTFKSINTRGFNSPANSRFVQRLDGVDMQTPGLSVPTGMLNGVSDLDVESIELTPGASSALYGPNAFNGVMNITSKDPFKYPGLSFMGRLGVNHIDSKDHNPAVISEFAVRFAKSYKDKFGFKINASYIKAVDWFAGSNNDIADYTGTTNLNQYSKGPGNPGFDGLNYYGDEASNVFDSITFKNVPPIFPKITKPLRVSRDGYRENYLIDYNTYSAKLDVGLYYRINKETTLSLVSRASRGTSILQADSRFSLNNFLYHNHKIEISNDHFFIRAYGTFENAGDSYDSKIAAINLNLSRKSNEAWFAQYTSAYSGQLNEISKLFNLGIDPIQPYNDQAARDFANRNNSELINKVKDNPYLKDFAQLLGGESRLLPGTDEFIRELERIKSTKNYQTGAKLTDYSGLYHMEGQYNFSNKLIKPIELLAGGNYRIYRLNSEGVVFGDSLGPIIIHEAGAYIQATKRFFENRLRFTASGRMDKITNFKPLLTPRIAAVLTLGKDRQHNFRTSFQTGFKSPDLRMQYVDFNVVTVQIVGGFEDTFERYKLILKDHENKNVSNSYTLSSANKFWSGGSKDSTLLVKHKIENIKPEHVSSFEVGYKGMILKNLLFDGSFYYNVYQNFLGSVTFVGPNLNILGNSGALLTAGDLVERDQNTKYRLFRRFTNSQSTVVSYGSSLGFTLFLSTKFIINSSYTYSKLANQSHNENDDIISGFNTPRNKTLFNILLRDIWKNFNFSVTHRWNDAFLYEYSFATGVVPAYNLIDCQIGYKISKFKTQVALGGTNILNNRHVEIYGGPTIGALLFLKLTYDDFFN